MINKLTYYFKFILLATTVSSLGLVIANEYKEKEVESFEKEEVEIEWYQKISSQVNEKITHYNGDLQCFQHVKLDTTTNYRAHSPLICDIKKYLKHCQLIDYN